MQFADDTLFFCEESHSNVVAIKAILRGFELASGLKINFHKSRIAGVNVNRNAMVCYAKILNCGQMGVPFKYLGLEVGGNPRKTAFWEPVLSKLRARLNAWRGRFLSLAGRICLIKSVITAVPLFYLSLYKAPNCVCRSIISLQRRFLWGWGKEKKPIAWVSWEVLCKPKEEGGLGIKDIRKFNYALLAKWRWRLISEEKGRWKEMLFSKYGVDLECRQASIKVQSWWWRDLQKVCTEGEGEGWFNQQVVWKVGSGDKVRFWEDALAGRIPTRESLSRRGVIMNTILCAMCELQEETCQHTFIECDVAQRVWVLCLRWIGIVSVQHNAILAHFESFYLPQLSSRQNLLWKGVWATIVACIWEQRNSVVFSQGKIDVEEIIQKVQLKSWQWLKHRDPSFSYSLSDWMLNPLVCIRSYK
ncbi:uncharacterized protein [Phaseolus vulgaris]|uniref:uncharacterized protein n=1 Tax=Phaseolus vulgaris TaxID=3885 RepID=UPI0035CAB63B